MKKLIMAVAIVCAAAIAQAAAVGWSVATGSTTYANDKYMLFVVGQNGATSIDTVTALLDAGSDVSSYAFASGNIGANGTGSQSATTSGLSLDAGTYTAFVVLFDSASPTVGESNYAVISGATGLTKTIAATTAQTSFATGAQGAFLSNASNWNSYGSVPEPTSGLLILLGMAGLALKRKVA